MITLEAIYRARQTLTGIAAHTPLLKNANLSERHSSGVWLKREDLQPVRSYKLRGAYNKIATLPPEQQAAGVVCASAGNHAQGVAFACQHLNIRGTIVMPVTTPQQKIRQVNWFGKQTIEIVLSGDTFDEAYATASLIALEQKKTFIHPFDDPLVIAGQATIALEILADAQTPIDYLFVPIGGGGLAAGLCTVFHALSPYTKIIGVEPQGAPSMQTSIQNNENTTLAHIDKFVDGAAVKRVGDTPFAICKSLLHEVITIAEGHICSTILKLYNEDAIVVEPAGALAIAALDTYQNYIKDKNVVCIVSGSNNDITRMEEIKERSLLYEGLKHYFLIEFPQRAGALRSLVNQVLSPTDDITYFQYIKKNNRETGPAVIGIELLQANHFQPLLHRMKQYGFNYQYLNNDKTLFTMIAV